MATGSARSNTNRATDPFWDKVIQATEVVTSHPGQRIKVTVKDQNAQVWFDAENDRIKIVTWLETEAVTNA